VFHRIKSGEHENGHPIASLANRVAHLQPRHTWQQDIQHNDVVALGLRQGEGFWAHRGLIHVVQCLAQPTRDGGEEVPVVFGEQDPHTRNVPDDRGLALPGIEIGVSAVNRTVAVSEWRAWCVRVIIHTPRSSPPQERTCEQH
jgi:hypothetical protein